MRAVLVTAIAMSSVALAGGLRSARPPARAAADESPRLLGVGSPPFAHAPSVSCAAAACHGGGHVGMKGSEYSTWAPDLLAGDQYDPHAKAYRVLFSADSARMAKLLGIAAPHREASCLNCHAVGGTRPAEAVSEGVGCGACHGPAEKWLAAHVEPGWKGLSVRERWEGYGFVPAGNLVARSLNCVGCHVGGPDREVNHDLIAAGHPRLAFESVRFHTAPHYRKHWDEKLRPRDFAARAWVAGQAATLRAATDLLRVRAERAGHNEPNAVWPEFAGYSCFACHQKMGDGELRLDAGTTDRPAGLPPWESWSNATAGVAARLSPDAFGGVNPPELRELAALRELMTKPVPDAKAVAAQASSAVAELDAWLLALQLAEERAGHVAPDAPRRFAHALAANTLSQDRTKLADHDRDALAANYLGCAAMWRAARAPEWASSLHALEAELKFPSWSKRPDFNSPAGFGRKERDRVRDLFRDLHDATAQTVEKR